MAPSKRSRKKQTRLTFDPVTSTASSTPASSDTVSKFSPAKIRYVGARKNFAAADERAGLGRESADGGSAWGSLKSIENGKSSLVETHGCLW